MFCDNLTILAQFKKQALKYPLPVPFLCQEDISEHGQRQVSFLVADDAWDQYKDYVLNETDFFEITITDVESQSGLESQIEELVAGILTEKYQWYSQVKRPTLE